MIDGLDLLFSFHSGGGVSGQCYTVFAVLYTSTVRVSTRGSECQNCTYAHFFPPVLSGRTGAHRDVHVIQSVPVYRVV